MAALGNVLLFLGALLFESMEMSRSGTKTLASSPRGIRLLSFQKSKVSLVGSGEPDPATNPPLPALGN